MEEKNSKNLEIYEACRQVPDTAKRPIEGGNLKGKSDINPVWRIKKLTELFGPAGFGWYIEKVREWTETDGEGTTAVFVNINLYVQKDGQWSKPICGTGGNKLIARQWDDKGGKMRPFLNDEAYKMAYTDAISVACKALGIGADVYWEKDAESTKYAFDARMAQQQPAQSAPAGNPHQAAYSQATAGAPKTLFKLDRNGRLNTIWTQSVARAMNLKAAGMTRDEIIQRMSEKYILSNIDREAFYRESGI